MIKIIKTGLCALAVFGAMAVTQAAHADSLTASLQGSGTAIGHILEGSGTILQGSTEFVIASVETVGDSTHIVLKGVSDGTEVSLNVSGDIVAGLAEGVGQAVQAIGTSAGTILASAGEVLMFIPNATVQALFHNTRYGG